MMRTLAVAGVLGLLWYGAAAGAEKTIGDADMVRVLEALNKAGLKVTKDVAVEDDQLEDAVEQTRFGELLAKLEKPEMSVEYTKADIKAVLGELQRVTGANFLLSPKAGDQGLTVTLKLDKVKPISILRNMLRMYDLVAVYADEAILVTLPSEEEPLTMVYDVHELTMVRDFAYPGKRLMKGLEPRCGRFFYYDYPDPDLQVVEEEKENLKAEKLIQQLVQATPNGQWSDERFSITHVNGLLIVTQRPSVQIEVGNVLLALKAR